MSKLSTFFKRWWLALLVMIVIFGFSSIPASEMPQFGLLDLIVKKGGHAFGYGVLALTYLHGIKGGNEELSPRWFYLAWAMAVVYSATDEFHQSFVPGRHPMVTDVIIDASGAALALLIASRTFKQKRPATQTGH
jgi:VanZ family protein